MAYSDKVMDHYNNPRNVGTLDKSSIKVGTGLVGAPECFSGDTLISMPEYPGYATLKSLHAQKTPFYVWSYNIKKSKFEIKKAICIHTGEKETIKLSIDDSSIVKVTPDHNFLTLENEYIECQNLSGKSIKSFNKTINSNGYWEDKKHNHNHKIKSISKNIIENVYTLMVEENNNYVVLTNIKLNKEYSGIVVKNCGDVMRLQIQIEDNIITDAKFKTFGCGSAIASSSLATEWLKGKSIEDAMKIDNMDIVEELSLPPVKIHCSVLAEDACKAAINDYRAKNGMAPIENNKTHH